MKTDEIIKEIEQLPLSKQIYVVERTIHTIRKNGIDKQMSVAADALYEDYKSDNNLTSFTDIDFDEFYDAR
ncbi:MAG: hypothetical protein JW842_05700 [Prolixibacteraceae bacterium]|nr:hypothetical protein [Prolixibacteraceae bacterium]